MTRGIDNQPISEVVWIQRDELSANRYNPNHVPPMELELLKTSILESGWTQPIVVANNGTTIIDGFHRWTVSADPEVAAMTEGYVPTVVSPHKEIGERMAASIRHNRARGEHGVRPMIRIVQRLVQRRGVKYVMQALGMDREEVLRLSTLRATPDVHASEGSYSKAWEPEGPPPAMKG